MTTAYSLTERTASEALEIWAMRTERQNLKTPLRYRPVIVAGPTEGYIVIELGYATANNLPTISPRELREMIEA
jgi:hypothetical protein